MASSASGADGGADFSTHIRREFAFFHDAGWVVDDQSPESVSWTKDERRLGISRDWRDGCIDIHLGAAGDSLWSFGLRHALATIDRIDLLPQHGWQATQPDTQQKYVVELADLIQNHLVDFLDSPADWETAHRLCAHEAHAYTEQLRTRQLRERATQAREAKDWTGVVRAYEDLARLGVELTAAEAARLEFARRASRSG